jgi:class 3 adenylate cyclase
MAVPDPMLSQPFPTGTVTFLFTDIEGSTRLWQEQPERMPTALLRHDALLQAAIAEVGGYVFKKMGDAFCAAFATATGALAAALTAQCSLLAEPWGEGMPMRVRMAVHTGAAEARDGDYFGVTLSRVARLLSAGHGGQTLLSQSAYDLCRDHPPPAASFADLGSHRLKDLARPEQVYQLCHPDLPDDFPPLRTLGHLLHRAGEGDRDAEAASGRSATSDRYGFRGRRQDAARASRSGRRFGKIPGRCLACGTRADH